jgi:hypothetical protein
VSEVLISCDVQRKRNGDSDDDELLDKFDKVDGADDESVEGNEEASDENSDADDLEQIKYVESNEARIRRGGAKKRKDKADEVQCA